MPTLLQHVRHRRKLRPVSRVKQKRVYPNTSGWDKVILTSDTVVVNSLGTDDESTTDKKVVILSILIILLGGFAVLVKYIL